MTLFDGKPIHGYGELLTARHELARKIHDTEFSGRRLPGDAARLRPMRERLTAIEDAMRDKCSWCDEWHEGGPEVCQVSR